MKLDNKTPMMLVSFKDRLCNKDIEELHNTFEEYKINEHYVIMILDRQDKAEVRIITDHIKEI